MAIKRLPVRPGDYVIFHVSGDRLLVTAATDQIVIDNRERGYPTLGQHMCGLMTSVRTTFITQITLDWYGYEDLWTIVRSTD